MRTQKMDHSGWISNHLSSELSRIMTEKNLQRTFSQRHESNFEYLGDSHRINADNVDVVKSQISINDYIEADEGEENSLEQSI